MKNNKNKKYIVIISIFAIISIIFGFFVVKTKSNKIMKNVYIDSINIGDISKEEAKEILKEVYKLENISLYVDDKKWSIRPDEIELSYNIDKTVENAYKINKGNNVISNIKETTKAIFGNKKSLDVEVSYNNKKIEAIVKQIAEEINIEPKDASLNISGGNILISDEVIGKQVDEKNTINKIIDNISNHKFNIEIIANKEKPTISKVDLENIDTVLGSHSTKFDSGVSGRSQNIRLSAKRTSDVLLMPGETFSYNEHTGKRNLSNGYKNAPVIVQGVVQEGIGGGVCQVSTTLYNATLYAGLEYIELRNHSIPSAYAAKGRDATVADGSIDFIFKNNLSYPIYIKNSVYGNTVTCQIYGSSKDKQKIEIITNVDAVSIAPIKKVDDPTIDKGIEKVLEKGRDGYTVSTYRIYRDGRGKEIRREKVSKSYYPKKQGVIAVGTKDIIIEEPSKEEIPPVEPPQPEVTPPQPEVIPPTEEVVPPQPEVIPPTNETTQPTI